MIFGYEVSVSRTGCRTPPEGSSTNSSQKLTSIQSSTQKSNIPQNVRSAIRLSVTRSLSGVANAAAKAALHGVTDMCHFEFFDAGIWSFSIAPD
jgi:hypothetical protein